MEGQAEGLASYMDAAGPGQDRCGLTPALHGTAMVNPCADQVEGQGYPVGAIMAARDTELQRGR